MKRVKKLIRKAVTKRRGIFDMMLTAAAPIFSLGSSKRRVSLSLFGRFEEPLHVLQMFCSTLCYHDLSLAKDVLISFCSKDLIITRSMASKNREPLMFCINLCSDPLQKSLIKTVAKYLPTLSCHSSFLSVILNKEFHNILFEKIIQISLGFQTFNI